MAHDELIRLSARQAVRLLRAGEVRPAELIDAAAARIAAVDGAVNALPTLCLERARAAALKPPTGWLAGLPIVVKDLTDVAGVRTTLGSPIFAERVPERSDLVVETLEANGALVMAKSNTPEFGGGANTFNPVFGATLNPWDTRLTCGGSSGGSAVALATGMAWLATGSDIRGSLRIPASFCSVVGLRPSPGLVARGPALDPFDTLWVDGPMARNVGDLALMLDAMTGENVADPLSRPPPSMPFSVAVAAARAPARVAFSPDLGIGPVDAEVAEICAATAARFAEVGATVEHREPDLSDAGEVMHVLRAANYVTELGHLLDEHRERLRPEIVASIERGRALTSDDIARARRARGALLRRVAAFFGEFDILACPAAIVPPFPVAERSVERLGSHRFAGPTDWLQIAAAITLTACPALSMPCGYTNAGLPVGLQLVGRPHGEAALLAAAAALEAVLEIRPRTPIDPRSPAGAAFLPAGTERL